MIRRDFEGSEVKCVGGGETEKTKVHYTALMPHVPSATDTVSLRNTGQ